MNTRIGSRFSALIAAIGVWLLTGGAQAAGLLTPTDGSVPPLSIKDQQVRVVIEDGYAVTEVEQVFHNPHARDLEAHYSFPVPEKGAVSGFTLWIDGRPVAGEVVEKQQARRIYEEEKAAGNDAGLTEQDAYRTFDVLVTPVRAGADTRIKLTYMQPAHVDAGIGRYVYPLEEGGVDEAKLAFWTANEVVTGSFSFDLRLRSAYPVEAVRVPGHAGAQLKRLGEGEWQVQMSSDAGDGSPADLAPEPVAAQALEVAGASGYRLDRDIVVYWRHQSGLPGSVDLVAHKPGAEGRGTFMLVFTPGDDLKPIEAGRDWVFVLDVSGSMSSKYATLVEGVRRALQKLRVQDRFRIVLFNDGAREITNGFATVTAQSVARFSQALAGAQPGGGTNLYGGLQRGLDGLDADRTSGLILVTDGVANVGETRQKQFIDLVRSKDVRLYTMVMGNSANRPLLDVMTRESGGFAISVSNSDDVVGQLLNATGKLTHQALHGVELQIDGIKTADLAPGRIGSLYRGRQLVLFGHYWGDGVASVTLGARVSGQPKQYRTEFEFPQTATDNPEIERLWAFAAIEELLRQIADFGEKPDIRQAVVDLATEYGLVTDYTSMLVVNDEVFARHGIARTNQARQAEEQAARDRRRQTTVPSRRVDVQQPMFSAPRAGHGGGSFDLFALLMLLPLPWLAVRARAR